MKKFKLNDVTLKEVSKSTEFALGFREKMEIVKLLNKINVDVIELPQIVNKAADTLFVKTASKFADNSVIALPVDLSVEGVKNAVEALKEAKSARIQIPVPVSTVQMEYMCHKKPKAIIELIEILVKTAKEASYTVEFIALDATRGEKEFLIKAINTAVENGADVVTVSDNAGLMMPNDFAGFVKEILAVLPENVSLGVECNNAIDMAVASSIASLIAGACEIKTSAVNTETTSLNFILQVMRIKGAELDMACSVDLTKSQRSVEQISRIVSNKINSKTKMILPSADIQNFVLNSFDDLSEVIKAIEKLGYDLSEEDCNNVYNEFKNIAEKKTVTAKELEAIIASVALQVPNTYSLETYVINSGNIINSTANLEIIKEGQTLRGVGIGDGPIDAAFVAIEQVIGHHYELDDFQIQSVTEGREAMGHALIKLRNNGKLYAGTGISTDIIGASIRAYINALNKIVYEEN